MPPRRLTPDTALVIKLDALIHRVGYNGDERPVADDVADIVATAAEQTDLLTEAVGLTDGARAEDDLVLRRQEAAAALLALGQPDVDRWLEVARQRRGTGGDTTEGSAPRTVDLPGVGTIRLGELPEL